MAPSDLGRPDFPKSPDSWQQTTGLTDAEAGVLVTAVQKVPLSKLLKHSDKSRDKIVTD